ncbi:MAG: sodium:proton antiporter [Myxococcota bacterium]
MSPGPLGTLTAVIATGATAQWIGWRFGVPSIVLLLAAGLTAGPGLGWLDPDALLGDGLFTFVRFATALVLFEGGLHTTWKELRHVRAPVGRLVSLGLLTTWVLVSGLAFGVLGLSPGVSLVLGAILVVTGPTVIQPLLRVLKPRADLGRLLRLEGVLNDPLGALLAILVFSAVQADAAAEAATDVVLQLGRTLVAGAVFGVLGGRALAAALSRETMPAFLRGTVTLATALVLFVLAESTQPEAGLLAVTLAGIAVGSQRPPALEQLRDLTSHLVVLLVSMLFVLLAARVDLGAFSAFDARALGAFLVGVLAVRFVAVVVSLRGTRRSRDTGLSWPALFVVGTVGPRGIVAAAVASLFGLQLEAAGFDGGASLMPLTFATVAVTVSVAAFAGPALVRAAGLRSQPEGVLVLGAGRVARELGAALRRAELRVVLLDADGGRIAQTRAMGLDARQRSPIAPDLEDTLDVDGFASVVVATGDPAEDALALARLADRPGQKRFRFPSPEHGRDVFFGGLARELPTPDAEALEAMLVGGVARFELRDAEADGDGRHGAGMDAPDEEAVVHLTEVGLTTREGSRRLILRRGDRLVSASPRSGE